MNTQQDDPYLELVLPIALLIYWRCFEWQSEHGEGFAVFEHFNDNRFNVPADVLARLGIMRPLDPLGLYHGFIDGWQPSKPLKLTRHPGEPSIFDLIVALCFLVDWDSQYRPKTMTETPPPSLIDFPDIDLRLQDGRRVASPDPLLFEEMAFRLATVPLIKLGLGSWRSAGGFELIFSLRGKRPIDLADTYAETRLNMAERLGGEQELFPPK